MFDAILYQRTKGLSSSAGVSVELLDVSIWCLLAAVPRVIRGRHRPCALNLGAGARGTCMPLDH